MTLWILSAMVSKRDWATTTYSMVQGYRVCATENEARGSFIPRVFEAKPGFSIDQLLCMAVPPEHLPTPVCNSGQ